MGGERVEAPEVIEAVGSAPYPFAARLERSYGLPHPDWREIRAWVEDVPEGARDDLWEDCVHGWLAHLREALGPAFAIETAPHSILLSACEPRRTQLTLSFMERIRAAILHALGDLIGTEPSANILVVFDDVGRYYDYVARHYDEAGEFGVTGGMFLDDGVPHFVTVKRDLDTVEVVIAHEMAHACVAHLPLPSWLNEGIAVNTERRVAPSWGQEPTDPGEHRAFWNTTTIRDFWSGAGFDRADEGQALSYDLARMVVSQMARDWTRFTAFARDARREDAGAAAARTHLGVALGACVAAILGLDGAGWEPDTREPAPA